MPVPLLLLQDINLTFGVTPLLSGAELAVTGGDRAPENPPYCALPPGWCSRMPDAALPSRVPQSVSAARIGFVGLRNHLGLCRGRVRRRRLRPRDQCPIDPHQLDSAQEVANDVLFLGSDVSNYMTGSQLVIDGKTGGARPL
jgi:hypothetical protein